MGCTHTKFGESGAEEKDQGGKAGGGASPPSKPANLEGNKGGGSGENKKLLDKYVLGKVLGQGAFGVVYSCTSKGANEKTEFAVKMIDQVETPLSEIKQEVQMLQMLKHPCVVKVLDVYYERVFVCIVMQKCQGGDMIEGMQVYWKSKGQIPMNAVKNMSKMMFQAVDWLHSKNCIHRDLKGDNFLQDRKAIEDAECRVYLSDFGTVREINPTDRLKQKCGTKTYWSPEFYALNYSFKVDVWALGVVIFGMIVGRFPFKGEEDVKNRPLKPPARAGPEGEEFLLGLHFKNEPERFSTRQALEHAFLANIKSTAEILEPWDTDFKPEVKESGANAAVKERRRELVERLELAQAKNPEEDRFMSTACLFPEFKTFAKATEKTSHFEWWNPQQVEEANFIDQSKGRVLTGSEAVDVDITEESIGKMLESHEIQLSAFGQGKAKSFPEFASECKGGQARLMLDASRHKTLVRCVDIVLLRITFGDGPNRSFLVKTAEKYPDGRMRTDINQLVGAKRLPHENGLQTAKRIVKDRLHMQDCKINVNYRKKECYEEEEESPSYPGVRTVYRKEIYSGKVTCNDPAVLARVGVGSSEASGTFTWEDSKNYTHYYRWITGKHAEDNKIRLCAPADGADVSVLVAPPIGLAEEELHEFLRSNKVDVSRFGQDGVKSLAEFSEELVQGEAALERREDGTIIRVVDVLIIRAVSKNGTMIVEVGNEYPNGKKSDAKRLPAVKRRYDENQFVAARRVLDKVLKINENLVTIDAKNILVLEEETTSKAYADLPTLYRRRIISCRVADP